jgi:hypothetical protein
MLISGLHQIDALAGLAPGTNATGDPGKAIVHARMGIESELKIRDLCSRRKAISGMGVGSAIRTI